MAFKENSRKWWKKVADSRCQFETYTEKDGFIECGDMATQIHHIKPEGEILERGEDPERAIGLPLCARHHVRNLSSDEHTNKFAFHPEAGKAYKAYGEWKQRTLHMEAITGRKATEPSPFVLMSRDHQKHRDNGDRYVAGTPDIDRHYTQKMLDKQSKYMAENPTDRKYQTAPHPRTDTTKRRSWWSNFFDGEDD